MKEIGSTSDMACRSGANILVYGPSGIGKTTLAASLPHAGFRPLVISSENGLLPLRGMDIPCMAVDGYADMAELCKWLRSGAEIPFDTLFVDSISDISEKYLRKLQTDKPNADGRQLYRQVQDDILDIVWCLRSSGLNLVMLAKMEINQDELGQRLFFPMMTGVKLGMQLPYSFDMVLAYHMVAGTDGQQYRMLQSMADSKWTAKDRSGTLAPYEAPDLGTILRKIKGETM